jgi:hypothetical protein
MIRASTGYVYESMLLWSSLFDDAVFRIYTGAPPASADLAPTGTYIGYITRDGLTPIAGHGLNFDVSTNGYVSKRAGTTWKMVGVGTGLPGYGRLSVYSDPPVDSPTAKRYDFQVNGPDNIGIILPPGVSLIPGLVREQPGFFFTIPR